MSVEAAPPSAVQSDSRTLDQYAITGGADGKWRLNLLAEIMRPTTLALLAQAGVHEGQHALISGAAAGT